MSREVLATIEKIIDIRPIPEAEKIDVADVLGWHVVVKKNEFSIGEMCVYIQVDSVLPEKPEFEFLRPRKFRIKTTRMLQQISQGICFPLSILPEGFIPEEGKDCTKELGIIQHELPEFDSGLGKYGLGKGRQKGNFPTWISRTDETRVQAFPKILDYLRGTRCYISGKQDGSSITIFLKDNHFGVCSRSMEKEDLDTCHFWRGAKNTDAERKIRTWSEANNNINIALQGELVGPGIQKNRDKYIDHTIKFFNVYNIDEQKFYDYEDFVRIVKEMDLETVPILNDNFVIDESITVDKMVELATRKSIINPDAWQEGIVVRPVKETVHQCYKH